MPFEAWHLRYLELQPSQAAHATHLTQQHGEALVVAGPAFTAFVGMEVIACAGVMEIWPGRAQVWSLLSWRMPTYYRDVHRAVKKFLRGYTVRRLECVVDPRHAEAVRWAKHLGFTYESTMPGYTPLGDTQAMYVRF
ncbi:MAG: hypothetical protein OEV08_07285 [Nitrospira sp.]|nr:hypothetical protein [Nitrospira sp.]